MLLYSLVAAALLGASEVDASFERKHIGFGVQRLKNNKRLGSEGVATTCDNVDQYWFKGAVLDNFAAAENIQHWEGEGQRYWVNKQFWSGPGAPIFVNIGGEGQESCRMLTNRTFMFDLAKEHNGLLVNVEHRFYGESYPTKTSSTENLKKYHSSQQALADLSRVLTHIKRDLDTPASKIITYGGSYPGNMAAWFRLKYPSITHGSIASSAPLHAQTNFAEYMEVVAQALIYYGGQKCYDNVESAAQSVADLFNQGPGSAGWSKLDADFKTCSPMATHRDLQILLSDLMGNFQGTVQYNNEQAGVANVVDICKLMTADGTPYDNFVKTSAFYREENGVECEDANWNDMLEELTKIEKDPNNVARPWTFQTCNEFGYFQTADSPHQPFHAWKKPLALDFYMDMCAAGFNGWTSEPQVDFINQVYGSREIDATNIVFVAGTIDPWHALGVTNYTSTLPQSTEYPVYILGTAHCNDMSAPKVSDTTPLSHGRHEISRHVAKFLA